MNIGPETPLNILRAHLLLIPEDTSEQTSLIIMEAADRLELLAAEVEDLRNQNHYNRVAAEARWDEIQRLLRRIGESRDYENEASDLSDELRRSNRHIDRLNDYITRLTDTGDAMVLYATTPTKAAWQKAKEDRP